MTSSDKRCRHGKVDCDLHRALRSRIGLRDGSHGRLGRRREPVLPGDDSEWRPRVRTRCGTRAYSTTWVDIQGRTRALANSAVADVERVRQPAGIQHWPESLLEINTRAKSRESRVILLNGTTYAAALLRMARDTTTWFDPRSGAMYSTPTANVASVSFPDGKRGTLRGLGIGALAGALGGIVFGFAGGDDEPGWFAFTAAEKAAIGALTLGVLGAPVGAVFGSGSEALYRFKPGALADRPTITEPVASPVTSVKIDKNARPSSPSVRHSRATWSVSAAQGAAFGGASKELRGLLRESGFGARSVCSSFCSGSMDYPKSGIGSSWVISGTRDVDGLGSIGILVSRAGWTARGFDGDSYLIIDRTVTTYAPMYSLQVLPAVRLGAGPALHRLAIGRNPLIKGTERSDSRIGLVFDFELTFPTRTRFYLDIKAQYRLVGTATVGPYVGSNFSGDSVFPSSRIGLSHGFLGAGLGMRL